MELLLSGRTGSKLVRLWATVFSSFWADAVSIQAIDRDLLIITGGKYSMSNFSIPATTVPVQALCKPCTLMLVG